MQQLKVVNQASAEISFYCRLCFWNISDYGLNAADLQAFVCAFSHSASQ